jgi:hypothetical protein
MDCSRTDHGWDFELRSIVISDRATGWAFANCHSWTRRSRRGRHEWTSHLFVFVRHRLAFYLLDIEGEKSRDKQSRTIRPVDAVTNEIRALLEACNTVVR